MDLSFTSYKLGTSEKGTDWLMLLTTPTYDDSSGRAELQRRCLMLIASPAEKDVASRMQARINDGKAVIVDSRFELLDK